MVCECNERGRQREAKQATTSSWLIPKGDCNVTTSLPCTVHFWVLAVCPDSACKRLCAPSSTSPKGCRKANFQGIQMLHQPACGFEIQVGHDLPRNYSYVHSHAASTRDTELFAYLVRTLNRIWTGVSSPPPGEILMVIIRTIKCGSGSSEREPLHQGHICLPLTTQDAERKCTCDTCTGLYYPEGRMILGPIHAVGSSLDPALIGGQQHQCFPNSTFKGTWCSGLTSASHPRIHTFSPGWESFPCGCVCVCVGVYHHCQHANIMEIRTGFLSSFQFVGLPRFQFESSFRSSIQILVLVLPTCKNNSNPLLYCILMLEGLVCVCTSTPSQRL